MQTLPEDCGVPGLPGWRWVHTPGHASFFREEDRALVVGEVMALVGGKLLRGRNA